jgi:hypothetical protein
MYTVKLFVNIFSEAIDTVGGMLITQVCTDFDVCIKLTVFEQFRSPDY